MKTTDGVGVTFVNVVLGRGSLNNIVNLTFGTFNFTPDEDNKIDPDLVISARLRMDVACAKQLHESLGSLLEAIEKGQTTLPETVTDGVATGKPN